MKASSNKVLKQDDPKPDLWIACILAILMMILTLLLTVGVIWCTREMLIRKLPLEQASVLIGLCCYLDVMTLHHAERSVRTIYKIRTETLEDSSDSPSTLNLYFEMLLKLLDRFHKK